MILNDIDEEELVFNAIQDYLNKNKILEKNEVINHIKSYFTNASININTEGIIKHVESLIKKRRIVEGSKLTKDIVLNNLNRKRIYDYITLNPGTYFHKIVKGLKMSNHVVYWHTSMLLQFELIRKVKMRSHEIFFNFELDSAEDEKYFFMNREKSKQILNYLKEHDLGISQIGLASALGHHPRTVKKYLKRLEGLGLIEKKKVSERESLYFFKR